MRRFVPVILWLVSACALLRPTPPTREELAKQGLAIAVAEHLVDEVWTQTGGGFLLVRPPTDTGIQRWDIRVRNVFLGRYPLMLRVEDTTNAIRIGITNVSLGTDTAVVRLSFGSPCYQGSASTVWRDYVFAATGTDWRFAARRPAMFADGRCPPTTSNATR